MDCEVCNRETNKRETIECNGCKKAFHYRCVNITPATAVKLKSTFKCVPCSNVTQRIRVTDDTPVRSSQAAGLLGQVNESLEVNITPKEAQLLTSDEIIDQINGVILAKISVFETNIIKEIKASVAVLALENTRLRQELNEANMKCSSYERQIQSLKTEGLLARDKLYDYGINNHNQRPIQVPTGSKCTNAPLTASSQTNVRGREHGVQAATHSPPPPQPPAPLDYAAVARNGAIIKVDDTNNNGWTEVRKNNRRSNAIKKGGNNSISSLKAVERRKFLHVWRLNKSTTEEDLREHIKATLGRDSEITIEKLKPKTERDYASFRVGVTLSNFEKLCDPEIWPINVEYSEWIWFRPNTNPNQPKAK